MATRPKPFPELLFGVSKTGIFYTELSLLAVTKGGTGIYVDLGNHVFVHTVGWNFNDDCFGGKNDHKYFEDPEDADTYIVKRSRKAIKFANERRKLRAKADE